MKRLNVAQTTLGMLVVLVCFMTTPSGGDSQESELEKKTDALLKVGDHERALKLIGDFILEHPEKPIGRAMLVKVFAANGQIEKALKAYYRFYKLSETLSPELLHEAVRSAVPALINVLLNDDDDALRSEAAGTLGELGDKRAVPALINALNDDDEWIRASAVDALGELGDKSAVPALINALNDERRWVRTRVTSALGKLGDKSAVPTLINILNKDDLLLSGADVLDMLLAQPTAAQGLGELGDRSAVPALINALNDDDSGVRKNAAFAVAKLDDKRAAPTLIEVIGDDSEDLEIKLDAAKALLKLSQSTHK